MNQNTLSNCDQDSYVAEPALSRSNSITHTPTGKSNSNIKSGSTNKNRAQNTKSL